MELTEKTGARMTLRFAASFLEVSERSKDGENFQLIQIPGEDMAGSVGRPALPLVTRLVAVPAGKTLQIADIKTSDTALNDQFAPWPSQGLRNAEDTSLVQDRDYYEGRQSDPPAPLVTVGTPALLRGVRVVPVRMQPVTWNPEDGSVKVTAEIETTFDLVDAADGNNPTDIDRPIPRSFATIYEKDVLGYEKAGNDVEGYGTYMVIYPEDPDLQARLAPLIDWRQRQGYNVVSANTRTTGTTTGEIKAFIQAQYNELKTPLEFVVLVGDANGAVAIPTFNENLSGYGGEGDHEYTLLDGNDVLSDVHIGRISVTSNQMLTDVIAKIVSYESDPYMDDDLGWFTRAGLSADPGASGYSTIWVSQWVKQQLLDLNYTQVDTIWDGNFASQIFTTINQGETLFTYRGYLGMSGVHSGYIDAMTNAEKLPFAMIVTCDTGSFSSDTACRSESFLRNPGGGAVAAMGTATIGTHTRYNNCFFQGVAEGLLNTDDSRLGPGLTRGKLDLYANYIDVEPDEVEIWSTWNNLMGDPATPMWTAVPAVLTVDYPDSLSTRANNLPVTVMSEGVPQVGALVAVSRPGVFVGNSYLATGITDASGRANISLSSLNDGEYLITVTGHNLKPHLGSVNVGPVVASIDLSAMTLDDSAGNGNGQPNPGETLEILVDLINSGTGGVNDVVGTLGSGSSLVQVTQPEATFGSIASGAVATGQQAYVVDLDSAVPGGTSVFLELVAGDGVRSWSSLVELEVSGPAAEVNNAILAGGAINPGESATLVVELRNIGDLATAGVTATLSSNSHWITVTDPNGSYGPFAATTVASNLIDAFAINAATDCYPGHVSTMTLDLVFAEGGTASLPVLVTVGTAVSTDPTGPDQHGYYAFDDTDTASEFAPVYDWVEIAPSRGGSGTSVGLTDFDRWQDDVVIMPLPFPFTYYGKTFNEISICSNGWVSMGGSDLRHYRNWTLPSAGTPDNLIAVYWDDLHVQGGNSGIYWWHDAANNRLIIEWDNVVNAVNTSVSETFQVILHDPAHMAGDTGDGVITMNYKDITPTDQETGFATVGIQNEDRNDAVLYTYYNLYPGGSSTITDGRSLVFRTVIPQAHGTLKGVVTNSADGSPVEGASINVIGRGTSILSAGDGIYQGSLVVGNYDVAVYHPSFAPDTTRSVTIEENTETVVDFTLTDVVGPFFELQTMPESTGDTTGPYDVVFKVSDFSGVQETRFFYTSSTSGGPFELMPQPEGTPDTWIVSIPGQQDESLVQYWLTSKDMLNHASREPVGSPTDVHAFTVAQTTVVYSNDMENATDWTAGIAGDDATSGIWENVDPNGIVQGGTTVVPEDDNSDPGTMCWVTGQDPVGSGQGTEDVDGGTTTLESPVFDVTGLSSVEVQYHRWYSNDTGNAPGQDFWVVQAKDQNGTWVELENTSATNQSWQPMSFQLKDHLALGPDLQFRFIASDLSPGSVVEAGVDDFVLTSVATISDAEAPQVALTSPDGSAVLEAGEFVDINWTQSDDIGIVHVEILMSTDGGALFDQAVAAGPLNGTFNWEVPDLPGTTNRLKVICYDSAGNSTESVSATDLVIGSVAGVGDLPSGRLALAQNSPNPFNPRTEISFSLPTKQEVTLRIYNVEGRLVRTLVDGMLEAGPTTVVWAGKDDQGKQAASGLFFYRLVTDGGVLVKKMTLLK